MFEALYILMPLIVILIRGVKNYKYPLYRQNKCIEIICDCPRSHRWCLRCDLYLSSLSPGPTLLIKSLHSLIIQFVIRKRSKLIRCMVSAWGGCCRLAHLIPTLLPF